MKQRFCMPLKSLQRLLLLPGIGILLLANQAFASPQDTIKQDVPEVYLDCHFCDHAHIKQEIKYVNYVRDRKDAGVHIQLARERAANSGRRYTLFMLGQHQFGGMRDTLTFNTGPQASSEEKRAAIIHALKNALMPYMLKTPYWKNLSVSHALSEESEQSPEDPWNHWVFELGTNGSLNAEEAQKGYDWEGSLEASKITKAFKLAFDYEADYEKDAYKVDSTTITSIHRTHDFDAEVVKSLTQHWSAGGYAGLYSSRYRNIRISYRMAPAVEYNIFPFTEATTRQLTFQYRMQFEHNFYKDTTIYNKLEQKVLQQSIEVDYEITKPWGSVDAGADYSHYLHDLSKQRLDFFGSVSLQLIKGLSVYCYSRFSFIHNQISLPKGDATREEVLTRQQQLATNYSYHAGFGISYTFGSMYNNIVNQRF